MNQTSDSEGYELFRQWDLFARVVHFNHMQHREITAALQSALREALPSLPSPLRVLDLGSGAGEFAYEALRPMAVHGYVGIDLSEHAVAKLKAKTLPGCEPDAGSAEAICGDMLQELRRLPHERFSVVLASFSLHHFPGPQKPAVLAEIFRVLVAGGAFFWIDTLRDPGESTEDFHTRLCQHVREDWHALSPDERESICTHIATCDYPEQAETVRHLLAAEPVTAERMIYRNERYGGWLFRKLSPGDRQ